MGYLTVPMSAKRVFLVLSLAVFPACKGTGPPLLKSERPAAAALALDLNLATEEELGRLPGVGPVTARKIIAHRQEHGRFARVEHLLLLDGISVNKFRKIRPYVTVR